MSGAPRDENAYWCKNFIGGPKFVCWIKPRVTTFDADRSVTDGTQTFHRCFSPAAAWFSSPASQHGATYTVDLSGESISLRLAVDFFTCTVHNRPVPVAARSKTWVCGRSPDETVGSNPTGGVDVCLLWVLCVLSGRGLCDELITLPEESYRLWCVVVCDLETSWIRTPWPTGDCRVINKKVHRR